MVHRIGIHFAYNVWELKLHDLVKPINTNSAAHDIRKDNIHTIKSRLDDN